MFFGILQDVEVSRLGLYGSTSTKHNEFVILHRALTSLSRAIDLQKRTWHLEPAHGGNCSA